MEERTIGQVLKAVREEQDLTLADIQSWTKIQKRYIRAMEQDDFEYIPGSNSQARQLLEKYAAFLNLDPAVILEAYDTDSFLVTYEINHRDHRFNQLSRRRNHQRRKVSYLPLMYLILISTLIVSFVSYTIWRYYEEGKFQSKTSHQGFQVISSSPSKSSTSQDTSSSMASSSLPSHSQDETLMINLSGGGTAATADIGMTSERVKLKLTVQDGLESWVAISNTDLAGGQLLSQAQPSTEIEIDTTLTQQAILTLGSVKGLTLKLNDQPVDLSLLDSQPATLTLNFK